MPNNIKEKEIRRCIDCGRNISNLHHNAKRCKVCAAIKKKQQDSLRHQQRRMEQLKWHSFVEDSKSRGLSHKNARGSKLRYWLDKICKILTIQELELLLNRWDKRAKGPGMSQGEREEYRTCAGMVRDWKDYTLLNQKTGEVTFDATNGVVFGSDGSYCTVDFDEENGTYVVRDSEGNVLYEIL